MRTGVGIDTQEVGVTYEESHGPSHIFRPCPRKLAGPACSFRVNVVVNGHWKEEQTGKRMELERWPQSHGNPRTVSCGNPRQRNLAGSSSRISKLRVSQRRW